MRDMNMVFLQGTISKETTMHKGKTSGISIANVFVATVKQGFNGKKDQTTFHTVVCFGDLADTVHSIFNVGDRVSVSGRIQNESQPQEDGTKRYFQKIMASHIAKLVSEESGDRKEEGGSFQGGKPPANFHRGESSPKAAFPYHDAERQLDWPKPGPNDEGCSFITKDDLVMTCAWLNPANPLEGGSVYEMKKGDTDWSPSGSIHIAEKTPF